MGRLVGMFERIKEQGDKIIVLVAKLGVQIYA